MHQCPNCYQPLNEGASFCSHCGTPISAGSAPASGGFFSSAGSLDGSPAPAIPRPEPMPRPEAIPHPAPAPVASAPVDAPPPEFFAAPAAKRPPSRRISAGKELKLLLRQGILILLGEKRNLIISLLFPVIAALITVWIAGEEMFVTFEATKSGCFILVCAAIWGGLFNSIQSLVKERDNIKRDYVSGALRIECYMGSRAIIQFALCVFQSFILALSVVIIPLVYDSNPGLEDGLLGLPSFLEFYLSLFMIMFASDALGLLISSFVKKEELASKLAPYILIAQLLFSGVLFKLEGGAKALSSIMISRWGMEALGSISDLNNQTTKLYNDLDIDSMIHNSDCPAIANLGLEKCECTNAVLDGFRLPAVEDMFEATSEHFLLVLFIMFIFIVVPLVAGDLLLHRVKKDGRD